MPQKYDAILMIAYGGPDKPEDIRPFLENVARGRPIPRQRLEEVAHHYELIGGKSPINDLTIRQAGKLERQLKENGYDLPVFVGMRNWHPLLSETTSKMSNSGIKKAIGLIMAAHRCDASWERYQRDVKDALKLTDVDLKIDYIDPIFDHPLFIEDSADRIKECFEKIPQLERQRTQLIFTAHSIPTPMAEASPYVKQLTTTSELIAKKLGYEKWILAYQSRSGRPTDPWLEPDICEVLKDLAKLGVKYVIVQPIGFLCDHVEVLFDIGIEAADAASEIGIKLLRAKTVNDDDKFIAALADAIEKHIHNSRR